MLVIIITLLLAMAFLHSYLAPLSLPNVFHFYLKEVEKIEHLAQVLLPSRYLLCTIAYKCQIIEVSAKRNISELPRSERLRGFSGSLSSPDSPPEMVAPFERS